MDWQGIRKTLDFGFLVDIEQKMSNIGFREKEALEKGGRKNDSPQARRNCKRLRHDTC